VPTSRRHRHVFAVLLGLLVVSLGAAACAMPSPPTPRASAAPLEVILGPCGLVVADAYGDPNMQPPYQMNMIFRPSGDEARITFDGTGWGPTRVSMSGPGKTLDATMGVGTDGGSMNDPNHWIMPAVGTWHFRLRDAHCMRVFDVEVKPRL